MRGLCGCVVLFAVLSAQCWVLSAAGGPQSPKATIAALLAAYDAGQYDVIDRTLAAEPKGPLADALRSVGDQWVKTGPAAAVDRRRMVAAALALEIAGAGLVEEWYDVSKAIEWACRHVRRTAPGAPAELWWHLGSIALLQDGSGLTGSAFFAPDHIARHSPGRLPQSDRIRLGKAIDDERDSTRNPSLVKTYTRLLSSAEAGEDARLRLGALHLRIGAYDQALAVLGPSRQSSDSYVGNVSAFLTGEALRRLGRDEDAVAAYRQALTIVPGAMSASLGLSAALVATGDMDLAIAAAGPAATPDAPVDPWRIFAYGEGRHWPRWREALRKAMRP